MASYSCCQDHWLLHWVGKQCLSPIKHSHSGWKIQTWTIPSISPIQFVLFFQFLAWFSKIMPCYKLPASPAALGTWSLLGTFSQAWDSRIELHSNTMAKQRRLWWIHTSQESRKEEGKESNSPEFWHSGKASFEPCISKQSKLKGELLWLESLLRDAHTLQLQLNSVKSQSTKRQASIGKQALLVWLLMEWFTY